MKTVNINSPDYRIAANSVVAGSNITAAKLINANRVISAFLAGINRLNTAVNALDIYPNIPIISQNNIEPIVWYAQIKRGSDHIVLIASGNNMIESIVNLAAKITQQAGR